MKALVLLNVAVVPYFIIAVSVGDKYISLTYICALMLASMTIGRLSLKSFDKNSIVWAKFFLYFLCFSFLGMIASPFGSEVWGKGVMQFAGIVIMLLMGIGVVISLYETPSLLTRIVRVASVSLGLFALVGVLQFVFWNLTPFKSFLYFSFLNDWFGALVWRDPGMIGGLHRINSLSLEPTHFGRYMGFVVGWALIRLGFFGSEFKGAISKCVPKWAAVLVLVAFVMSISMNAWILMVFSMIALTLGLKRITVENIRLFVGLVLLVLAGLLVVVQASDGLLVEKFNTINLIFESSNVDLVKTGDLTALAFAANATVAIENFIHNPLLGGGLGSHPVAYVMYAPAYVYLSEPLNGLNATDADSLALRLLSETGMVGLFFVCGGVMLLLVRSRQLIMQGIDEGADKILIAISAGAFSSTLGMFALYLIRTGHYYDPVFWLLIALVAGCNNLLYSTTSCKILSR